MLAQVMSGAVLGVEAYLVRVEVDMSPGLPCFLTVGLPTEAVREGRDRVLSALRNSGFALGSSRVTVNLSPADLRKAGAAFDLPISLGLLIAGGELAPELVRGKMFLGELGLDGRLRPVTGVLPISLAARRGGLPEAVVPPGNAGEASLVEGLKVRGLATLTEVVEYLAGRISPPIPERTRGGEGKDGGDCDLAEVRGQEQAKRALEVAAAGGHNLLLVGPPGAGKTMLARRLPTILPPLTREEALEVTSIHSAAGKLPRSGGLIELPTFRAPHHTVSYAGLVGGGRMPRPGEVSLAHRGVLFLDELPEFSRHVLESLRQPVEEGKIFLVRSGWSAEFPALFTLVAAMNACPCGGTGNPRQTCRCGPLEVKRYLARVSGPLLDRVDIQVSMPPVTFRDLQGAGLPAGERSGEVARRVSGARERQRSRLAGRDGVPHVNARLSIREVRDSCRLDRAGAALLRRAMEQIGLSARAYHRILRVARTVADLEGAESIAPAHVAEAIQYRSLDRLKAAGASLNP